jgi:NTE family protein
MNTSPSSALHTTSTTPATGQRALVLGGGGSTGNAWLIGVVAGLFEAGLDVTAADLTVGTSAGSTAAAQVAGATPAELYAATVDTVPPRRMAPAGSGPRPHKSMADHLESFKGIIASSEDAADMRRRMGAAALDKAAASDDSWQERWRATVASRLPTQHWPQRTVLITAVDAQTGDPVAFDRHSGVDLVDAVAASCAGGGLPYRIGDHAYIDGGYRRGAENADLAAGHERVLVLSPLGGGTLHPSDWGMHLAAQVDELHAGGSRVETIFPDSDAEHMFGAHAMDLSLRPPAARAGYGQGQVLADQLTEFWR